MIRKIITSLGLAAFLAFSPRLARAEDRTDVMSDDYLQETRLEFTTIDAIILGINVAAGCVTGSVPRAFRNEGIKRDFDGCLKGAVGGVFVYGGVKSATRVDFQGVGWLANWLTSLGASMKENVGRGHDLFDRVAYDVGFLRLSVGKRSANDGSYFGIYMLPGSLAGVINNLSQHNDFDVQRSSSSGTLVFVTDRNSKFPDFDNGVSYTFGNVVTLNRNRYHIKGYTIADDIALNADWRHEEIHAVQYRDYASLSDPVLNPISFYRQGIRKNLHISLESDASAGFFELFDPLDHDSRPPEFMAEGLQPGERRDRLFYSIDSSNATLQKK